MRRERAVEAAASRVVAPPSTNSAHPGFALAAALDLKNKELAGCLGGRSGKLTPNADKQARPYDARGRRPARAAFLAGIRPPGIRRAADTRSARGPTASVPSARLRRASHRAGRRVS